MTEKPGMDFKRRNLVVYGVVLAVWALVVAWQADEHFRVQDAARTELRGRAKVVANFLSAVLRGLKFRRVVFQTRLEPVLSELVNERTNQLAGPGELLSIALLNTAGEPIISAGDPIDFAKKDILQEGEHWSNGTVTFVTPVEGASRENATNPTVLLPPRDRRDFTNNPAGGFRGSDFPRHEPDSEGPPPGPPPRDDAGPDHGPDDSTRTNAAAGERDGRPREGEFRPRRPPPWARWTNEKEFETMFAKNELHGLVLVMSTDIVRNISRDDLWLRFVIVFFAGISAVGVALAWRNLLRTSDLQIRLVRASEVNTHLKELNLAAAGLAHETRNPLNIVRGLAQMISKQPDTPPEIRNKSREIIEETDKVTAQLNEFINYSRPREVRRAALALNSVVTEVVRALNYDIEEKKIRLEVKGELLTIEADEQLLRQALFNLVLNAVQAVDVNGEIQIVVQRPNAAEAAVEIRDNGPGVPVDRRSEIFKPYFTTQQKGTGLGLAIVQQIVLAHGWEIACLANEPKGAVFRITHLKLASKA